MAEVLPASATDVHTSQSKHVLGQSKPRLPSSSVTIPPPSNVRNGHLSLDILSPVNQNGSFEFDRVLKSGEVYKRTRKTRWKRFHLVLRPNLLSIYKNASEDRLHKQINMSDVTAVAFLKDPKGRRQHVFGFFLPSRNYQLQADNDEDARAWVGLIRKEARIDEEELEMYPIGPLAQEHMYRSLSDALRSSEDLDRQCQDRMSSSSPEPFESNRKPSTTRDGVRIPGIRKQSLVQDLEYSGNEFGSHSDFSDSAPAQFYSQNSPSRPKSRNFSSGNLPVISTNSNTTTKPEMTRNTSQLSVPHIDQEEERVIWQGHLLCLKSKGGVRQWKKLWVVLRPKHLAFYKNQEEYATHLLIPLSNMISAVEIDPISRSKSHCMQIIAEDRNYRFCTLSEETLAQWLGALKSQIARKKENKARTAGMAVS